jgi:soluble lytic murein transglycosylase-like protein
MSASRKLQGGLIMLGALIVLSIGGWASRATANDQPSSTPPALLSELQALSQQLESVRGELAVARLQLDRANAVIEYSGHYLVPADLAEAINDIALAEGIEPSLAFRLVKVESRFDPRALSSAGAIGLTQILPSTARLYEPGLSTERLYNRGTNLRLGFRYLHDLLERYDNDLEHALLAYNRGPAKVRELLNAGVDPRNGYSRSVMKGYHRQPPAAAE